jgi:hypothetical protein
MSDSPGAESASIRATIALLAGAALCLIGVVGIFFLFFGDADSGRPDPRDAAIPDFGALLIAVGGMALGVGAPVIRRTPYRSGCALLLAVPWFLLGLLLFVRGVIR